MKNAPNRPPRNPIRTKKVISKVCQSESILLSKSKRDLCGLITLSVIIEISAQ